MSFLILRSFYSYGWQWLSQGIFVSFFFFFLPFAKKEQAMCERLLWRFWKGSLCDALFGPRVRNKSTRCAVLPLYSISPLLILSTSSAPVVALMSQSLSSQSNLSLSVSEWRNAASWETTCTEQFQRCVCVCVCCAEQYQDHSIYRIISLSAAYIDLRTTWPTESDSDAIFFFFSLHFYITLYLIGNSYLSNFLNFSGVVNLLKEENIWLLYMSEMKLKTFKLCNVSLSCNVGITRTLNLWGGNLTGNKSPQISTTLPVCENTLPDSSARWVDVSCPSCLSEI